MINKSLYNELQIKVESNKQQIVREKQNEVRYTTLIDTVNKEIEQLTQAIELCALSLKERSKIKEDIEELATLILHALFDENYRFAFDAVYDEDGLLVGLKPQIYHFEVGDDPKNYGGGVRNIVSFAVRLLFVWLGKGLAPILVLDEPFVNLDKAKWEKIVKFLEDLQRDLQIQVIMITHSGTEFPQTFVVRKPNKVSIVEAV